MGENGFVDISKMSDREVMEEILTRLRSFEVMLRGISEASNSNPMMKMLFGRLGI